jgi:acylphosphatase
MPEKRKILFFGRVQGVGFRYTACRAAAGYNVTGYVRNLADGTVECFAEGEAAEIDSFLTDLTERMGPYITRTDSQTMPASGQWTEFGVRY